MRSAVVVNVGWVPGISAIQSLGRAGVPVHAVDHRPDALGFRSRYARSHLSPQRLADEPAWVRFLASLELDGPAPVFPLDDDDLNALARNADTLAGRFLFPFPERETLARIQDKRRQLDAARAAGVPAPHTTTDPHDDVELPVLVKPAETGAFRRAFGTKAFRCETRAELERAWEDAAPYDPVIWEWIPGGEDELYTLGSYVSRDGRALGIFSGRKLLQDPPLIGNARVAEACWVDEVVEQGLALLAELGCHGPSQVEFKRDPRDGRYKLIEVNPRLWQWHSLAEACGVNLPLIAYRDLLGERQEPATMRRERKRWSITLKAGRRPAPQRPPYVDPLFARDEPAIALEQLRRFLRPFGRRFRRVDRSVQTGARMNRAP